MTTPFITERRSPLKFFLLVFALSIPFWLIGAVTPLQLLPGLPVSSLMAFCPLIAASILVYREGNRAAQEIIRLPANQSEGLVRPHRPSNAWHCCLGVWTDALVTVTPPNPEIPGSVCTGHVPCILYRLSR